MTLVCREDPEPCGCQRISECLLHSHVDVELIFQISLFEVFVRTEKCHSYFIEVVGSEIVLHLSLQYVHHLLTNNLRSRYHYY